MSDSPSRNPCPVRAAVFDDVVSADRAVANLLTAGFAPDQLGVVCSDEAKRRHFAGLHEEAPSGSQTSRAAAAGGAIGLSLGSLAALGGIVATGGVGLFAAGAVLGAGVGGSFIGAMLTRGVEREAADFYDQELRRGQILVLAESDDRSRLDVAEKAMHEAGAIPFPLRGH